MPTPISAFANLAFRHGGVDPEDIEAIQNWFLETLPNLPPDQIEDLLEELLEQDGEPSEGTFEPRYPRGIPLPRLETSVPAQLPLLARLLRLLRQ